MTLRCVRPSVLALALASVAPTLLESQTVIGVVVDRGDIPVSGVVLLLLDSASDLPTALPSTGVRSSDR
jgi:hypothetical protein